MRLSDWPSLRLVIPLSVGIIISDTIGNAWAEVPVWCALSAIAFLITLFLVLGHRKPGFSGLLLSLCFVVAGVLLHSLQMQRVKVEWPDRYRIYNGMVTSYPLERERTYRVEVTLLDSLYKDRNIYLYLPKDSAAQNVEPGCRIVFDGKINKPSSQGVDFDYASYLLSHGISGTLRVQAKDWHSLPPDGSESLRIRSVRFRRTIIRKYREWGLQGNALAVASAVSLGEKRALDDGLRQVYSTSGVSHVLAVSGLHVGIMCWFLYLIFPSVLFRRHDWMRELLVMGILWTYAFVIGLPVSITRSLIMFSIVAVCRAIDREGSALNSLGIAALILLVANPSALFDMSFQLSFSAVLFIIIITPMLIDVYDPRNPLARYLWRIMVLSFSAQIGTTPIVLYHFSGFSTYVMLANLFVVPVMFVVVALSMSLWITGWIPLLRGVTVSVLTWIIDMLNRALTYISQLPHARMELSVSSWWHVFAVYVVVIMVYLWLKQKRTHYLVEALACIAAVSIMGMFQSFVI